MKKLFIVWLLGACMSFIVLNSCRLAKIDKCQRITNNYKADMLRAGCDAFISDTVFTTQTEIKYRDTTIFVYLKGDVKTDTVKVWVKNGIINSNISTLQTQYAKSNAWVENGILKHTLQTKDTTLAVRLKNALKEINYYETIKFTEPKPVVIEKEVKKPIPTFLKFLTWSGVSLWILIIIIVIIKFTTIKIPFLK